MKFNVGDMFLVKDINPYLNPRLLPLPLLRLRPLHDLKNTIGIITAVKKHSDIFKWGSTENDNGYVWYSQIDMKEYFFFEDEVDGEVVK